MEDFKMKKLIPLNNQVLLTADRYEDDVKMEQNGLLLDLKKRKGAVKFNQTVVAIGGTVRELKVGDKVVINYEHFVVPEYEEDVNSVRETIKMRNTKTKIFIPTFEVDGENRLLIYDRDIMFKYE